MAINQWNPTSLPVRPGLYTNFIEAAAATIQGGERGTVAIPIKTYTDGSAVAGTFYTIERESEAVDLFGNLNITSIRMALAGGASKVIAYAVPSAEAVAVTLEKFEAYHFNVFVFDGVTTAANQDAALAWLKTNRNERKHFFLVVGGTSTDDNTPASGNSRSARLKDDYVINLVSGFVYNGVSYASERAAAYVAGLIAGTPINQSITYSTLPVEDVTKRLRNSEIVTALGAGSLVLFNDGENVKIEKGIATSGAKIRKISARQQIATDIEKTARDSFIGKLNNDADGQAALVSAITLYLETLEASNVLNNISVSLDPAYASTGDRVFLLVSYYEIDSMEQIFLSINV